MCVWVGSGEARGGGGWYRRCEGGTEGSTDRVAERGVGDDDGDSIVQTQARVGARDVPEGADHVIHVAFDHATWLVVTAGALEEERLERGPSHGGVALGQELRLAP